MPSFQIMGNAALDLLPPEISAFFPKVVTERGDGWRLPSGEGRLDLWGLKPGAARDFLRKRLCDFRLRCFEEALCLNDNRKASIPTVLVSCIAEGYPARHFFERFAKKARVCGWQVNELFRYREQVIRELDALGLPNVEIGECENEYDL